MEKRYLDFLHYQTITSREYIYQSEDNVIFWVLTAVTRWLTVC